MRTLCKKALALCVVFALALTCFVGTLSVSAADPYDATITVADVAIDQGTTSVDVVLNITAAEPGINEAIISVSSDLGSIAAEPKLTSFTATDNGDAYVDVVGDDFSKIFLSARKAEDATDLNGITAAAIKFTFDVAADKAVGDYAINIATDGVKAADKNETVVNFVYEVAKVTVVAPHVHNVVWTSDNAGNHTSSCDAEGCKDFEAATEACADGEDEDLLCDKCGYDLTPAEPEGPVYNADVKVKAKNALFQSDYSLMFAIPTATAEGWYLVVEQEQFDKNTKIEPRVVTLTAADEYNQQDVKGVKCHTVLLTGIGARDVASKVSITLYAEVDGVMSYGPTEEYNLVTYARKQIDNGAASNATNKKKNFAKAMVAFLNYAADAQNRFEYNQANLATVVLTDAEKAMAPLAAEPVNYRNDEYVLNENATASIQTYAPQYKDKMTLALLAYAPNNADAVVEISYTNYKGQKLSDSLPVAGGIPTNYKGLACMQIDFTSIAFADVRSNIELKVVDAEGNVLSNTYLYSFETYAAGRKTTSADYAPSRSLVNFGDYIKTYFLTN